MLWLLSKDKITKKCWFSQDVTKNSNYKTIDPTEILLSQCIRAAEH